MRKKDCEKNGFRCVFACIYVGIWAQTSVTLEKVVNEWSLHSPSAEKVRLDYENTQLAHKNYLKGFLPSIALNLNPISFNHSLRLMQNPTDGGYSYVNDFRIRAMQDLPFNKR